MAAAAHVKRFLFLSSVKVNGEETHDQPFAETDRPAPLDFYAVSKWKAEECSCTGRRTLGGDHQAPLVYGPVRAFLQLIRWVVLVTVAFGKNSNKQPGWIEI
jgi:UDP-glucose 4-epimerase